MNENRGKSLEKLVFQQKPVVFWTVANSTLKVHVSIYGAGLATHADLKNFSKFNGLPPPGSQQGFR